MNYKKAIEYLYNSRPYGKIKYGLFRMEELMDKLGKPQNSYPIIHITGTNGKGSVAAMITSILIEMGFKVGLNISPHIISFKERFQINRNLIAEDEVVTLLEEIRPYLEKMDAKGEEFAPSFFEVITAMAFLYFKMKNVDIAVVEVGLGGRYDASNVIEKPLVSIITTVGLDHHKILGNTEEEISSEKAGIIKSGRPVVSGVTRPSIRRRIEDIARKNNSRVYFFWRDFQTYLVELKPGNNLFHYEGKCRYENLSLSLNGIHQLQNAGVAIKALEVVSDELGIKLKEDTLKRGLSNTTWPGRFEKLTYMGKDLILDGAHNPEGTRTFIESVRRYFGEKKIRLLFGALDDKDYKRSIQLLSTIADEVIVTRVSSHRSTSPENIYRVWKTYVDNVKYIDKPKEALEELLKTSRNLVFCVGSLYLVSEIRQLILGGEENA
ncbi:bifunctional folylpolyglutamate synthase/dihydrofolate synthase [Kosmotoga pacifica]|uniref:Dihydrofolate synthase/folylpolyglutamate synthase n=1 Tax=Kosmotoga pacifica TaxID=1330330 RepID=A0A0G2ZDI2_9BACT|nr:folylpolyglutamate synthase/dihydrofolate synthase family protein [Kosmotoga pacifica]AKI96883.1 folylpolyglutamate synthase [Kosmotoga pacifica]